MIGDLVLLEFTQDVADLETLLEVIVTVCIDQLKVFASVKDDSVILVVRPPAPPELDCQGTPSGPLVASLFRSDIDL